MAVATYFSDTMASLTGNQAGAVQVLPGSWQVNGRRRSHISRFVLAGQVSGSVLAIARIPLYAALISIEVMTDTSLATATIAYGDSNNPTLFSAAATLTATQTLTRMGPVVAQTGVQLLSGYDSVTGNLVSPFMPQKAGQGGFLYEDIVITVGTAALPVGGGTLLNIITYMID